MPNEYQLTWFKGWPLLTSYPDIIKWDVTIGEKITQWLSQCFDIEVVYFVIRHCGTVMRSPRSKQIKYAKLISVNN